MSAARGRSRTSGTTRFILLAAVIGVLLAFAVMVYRNSNAEVAAAPDFDGDGTGSALLQVEAGDTLAVVGDRLYDLGTVASTRAFTGAAAGTTVEGIQPGYYQVREEMSAASAVETLADPESRVGFIEVKPGGRLLDTVVVGGGTEKGIFTLIAEATCLRDLETPENPPMCRLPQEIVDAAVQADPVTLGVPEWAINEVRSAPDPVRRLEGLVAPGVHNVNPQSEPVEILRQLIDSSTASYDATGLVPSAQRIGLTPYQVVTAASLVEKEGALEDFDKIARVILNRLAEPMRLQFDSTVNYALADQEIATTDADRGAVTPWNTYAMDGLPYGPIGSPGLDALRAMENPAEGRWKYFVTIDMQGTTRFADEYPEHERYQSEAIANGVLSSGR
ncbi:endolytic transglycosylase MltG [Rhodococcus sp. IEGM 1408]|uniref:endolytic transglycosylase MltG n=1 Tax=Rhodococcus sp. IEGM 1408 TaxID=3082220 RepID=UPI0029540F16|nr:endolytic transglycosylase MltG [Rhodococcus sp. IEGM 1408]MDV8000322.1 endolytic transglycosylase MltG [Rhodococcus sp. IEGM 1408]